METNRAEPPTRAVWELPCMEQHNHLHGVHADHA